MAYFYLNREACGTRTPCDYDMFQKCCIHCLHWFVTTNVWPTPHGLQTWL